MGLFEAGTLNLAQLTSIESKIDQLLAGNQSNGSQFTPVTLSPTYQLSASNGWAVTPSNLTAITDGDSNTSTNLFQPEGGAFSYGEIQILPGTVLETYSRINCRIGCRNSHNQRSYFELAAYNVGATIWTTIWATIDAQNSTTDTIYNVDRIIPFVWDKLRFRLWDIGQFFPKASIYELKVWNVN